MKKLFVVMIAVSLTGGYAMAKMDKASCDKLVSAPTTSETNKTEKKTTNADGTAVVAPAAVPAN